MKPHLKKKSIVTNINTGRYSSDPIPLLCDLNNTFHSRSKSHESSKSRHSRHHRKHSHSKHSHHKSHRSGKDSISPHHSRSAKPYYDYHHPSTYRHSHYHHYPRASSIESDAIKYERTHSSRSVKREKSKDDSHSKTRSKGTSRERKSRSKWVFFIHRLARDYEILTLIFLQLCWKNW